MTAIQHHIPDPILIAYASGRLEQPFALAVAAHVSLCDECRAQLGAHECVGGALLEDGEARDIAAGTRAEVMARLDAAEAEERAEPARRARSDVFPGPVMEALKGRPPRWRSLGMGVRQAILSAGSEGSARLLYIPPGQAVPDHGHHGLEMTLVLQGAFNDETGRFGPGDVEIADDTLEHTPVAEEGAACICLAATDAPLRFTALLPRILQPFFRI